MGGLRFVLSVVWAAALLLRTSTAATRPHEPSLSDVIKLEVVASFSGDALLEAPSTSHVLLRVSFTEGQYYGDVSLYDCVASRAGGEFLVQLTDFTGCPAIQSPMGCMVQENELLVSPEFELSSLADDGDVNITCSWEPCSESHHPKCQDRCSFFTAQKELSRSDRSRRQSRDDDDRSRGVDPQNAEGREGGRRTKGSHSISTRIRVLPSHVGHRHHHGGHHAEHHGMGSGGMSVQPAASRIPSSVFGQHHEAMVVKSGPSPLMYLNPIVCSLFLLMLAVFLGIYVAFVRSLGRTVHHIQAEIERQRSRDKFLLPPHH